MPRESKGPRYWAPRNQWVATIRGVKHYFGHDEEEAKRQWHLLMAEEPTEAPAPKAASPSLIGLLDEFLEWVSNNKPDSFSWYSQRIVEFAKRVPSLTVAELKPHHVQSWIDTKKSSGHKRGCLVAVHRGLNWAVEMCHIDVNPLQRMKKPSAGRRELVIDDATYAFMRARADPPFHDLLTFAWETGARPQESLRLEARHLDLAEERAVFPEKESKGKKRKRVIYLSPAAIAIVKRLALEYPEGRLFRNADGEPWTRNQLACRFTRLRAAMGRRILKEKDLMPTPEEIARVKVPAMKRGKDGKPVARKQWEINKLAKTKLVQERIKQLVPQYCLYHLRHTYCTRALKRGVDPITLAELLGHADATMVMRIYQKVYQDTAHLKAAARKALAG